MFKLSHERMMKMNNEARCTFPKCDCEIPGYALSMYNRTEFCNKLKEYEELAKYKPINP